MDGIVHSLEDSNWNYVRNPRTGVCISYNGNIKLVTIAQASKILGVTSYPDVVQEPVLERLDARGERTESRRLFFTDPAVEDRRYMGQTGQIDSLQVDSDGNIWLSGGNHIFERKDRKFYYNNDSYQLNERNGFVARISAKGVLTHRVFPGTEFLRFARNADGSVALGGDRFFSKIVGSEF